MRALKANEIELRVANCSEKGSQWLLYKDARCDKRILDETFGVYGWQNSYHEIKGNLFCTISIYDKETGYWIDKEDCGTESYTEKEKGEASDAFKRACFNIGIGRELYTKIFIWIPAKKLPTTNKNGKWVVDGYPRLKVSEIETDMSIEKITHLIIVDDASGQVMFEYNTKEVTPTNIMAAMDEMVNEFAPKLGVSSKTLSNSIIKKYGADVSKYDIGEIKLFLLKEVQNAKNKD